MSETTTTHQSCIYDRYIKYGDVARARFNLNDCLPKYILKTLNLEKIRKEDLNLKINRMLQNDPCGCDRCNPDTSGRI